MAMKTRLPKRIYSEQELQALCEQYQKLLGIADWDIKVSLVPQKKIKGVQGRVIYDFALFEAQIQIPTPDTFKCRTLHGQDMQQTLLHELIHVVLAWCDRWYDKEGNTLPNEVFESAINRLANGFCQILPEPAPPPPEVVTDWGEPEKEG